MRKLLNAALLMLFTVVAFAQSAAKEKLAFDTPKSSIIAMDPARVDPSDLPLDRVDQLHLTGNPQEIPDISTWRLAVTGKSLGRELSLSYADLMALPMVKKRVLLICPGFFADYVEWEGVSLSAVLTMAKARPDFAGIAFRSYDGYTGRFSREEAMEHLLFLAVKVNGQTLPTVHGYPVRLVAEDLYGGRWVKWIAEIRVE
ncbi:MAG TPA: molybdopterin-dependent oxidoreductase [Spirochaetia bacterium]|nr:molybdopterin-dependent oxidoreductase [Spirochaetia bacterium]